MYTQVATGVETAGSRALGVSLSVYTCLASGREGQGKGGGYIFPAMVPVQWLLLSDSRGLLSVLFPAPKFFLGDTGLRRKPKTM